MKYRCFISLQIHSNGSSFSSNDVFLFKEVSKIDPDAPFQSKEIVVDRIARVKLAYQEDNTFVRYGRGDIFNDTANTPEFKALVERYIAAGWQKEIPFLEQANKARWEREERKESERKKRTGHVLWKPYEKLQPQDYVGGFSPELLNEPQLKAYVDRGRGVFGYIGHSARRFKTDAYLEKTFMALKPKSPDVNLRALLACWLTSSDGRHFGDSLEDLSYVEAFKRIKASVQGMFDIAVIYSDKEHRGTWKSTQELKKKHANELFAAS